MSEIISQITQSVLQKLPHWYGAGTVLLTPEGQVEKRPFSYLIRYQIGKPDGSTPTIIAKYNKSSLSSNESTPNNRQQTTEMRKYYDTLTKIAHIFAEKPTYCYIRPLDYLSSHNTIIMEELPSHSLRDEFVHPYMLVGSSQKRQKFLAYLMQASSWLHIYHTQVSSITMERFTQADLKAIIDKKLNYLHSVTNYQLNTSHIEQRLADWLEQVNDIQVPHAHLHKDYSYANVLITPDGRIGSLDTKHRYGAIYEDLAHLIIDGYTGKWQILSQGLIFSPNYLHQCQQAILNGYFQTFPVNNNLLNFYCILASLNKWIYTEKNKLKHLSSTNKLLIATTRRYLHRLPSYFTS